MTDNEIVKALEDEIHLVEYVDGFSANNVDLELLKNTLDLIKRQQAEIKQLQIALFKQEETIQLISKEKQEEIAELRVCAEKNNDKLNSVIDCQKAEIERLTGYNSNLVFANQGILHTLETEIKKAKSEAITEFAERLKDMHKHNTTSVVSLVTLFGDINKMVKEMTEDINDT